jgi:hypothetical protein
MALRSCCLSSPDARLCVSAEACNDDLAALEPVLERRKVDGREWRKQRLLRSLVHPLNKVVAVQVLASQQDQRMGNGQHRPQLRSATVTQAAQPWTPGIRCERFHADLHSRMYKQCFLISVLICQVATGAGRKGEPLAA